MRNKLTTKPAKKSPFLGYHDCPCTECFEIAIGAEPDGSASMCHACGSAGCVDSAHGCLVATDEIAGMA